MGGSQVQAHSISKKPTKSNFANSASKPKLVKAGRNEWHINADKDYQFPSKTPEQSQSDVTVSDDSSDYITE